MIRREAVYMHFYSNKLQRMMEFCVGENGQLIPAGATALSGNIMFAWNNSSGNWVDQGWNNSGNWQDKGWNNSGNWIDQGWNNSGNWQDKGWSNSSGNWGDSGSGGGGCFITTACVEEKGLSDDCHEMHVLRKYRDILVAQDEEFRSKVLEYYRKAPLIIQGIESEGNTGNTYNILFEEMIKPCVQMLDEGRVTEAKELYLKYYEKLSEKYLAS